MKTIDDLFISGNQQIFRHRKCVFIVGAGISVASGIPDFRSPDGIFSALRKQLRIDGRQLFTYNFGVSEGTREIYLRYMADLKRLCDAAKPNAVHRFLAEFPRSRTYTQNIDMLEERAGMVFAQRESAAETAARKGSEIGKGTNGVYLHGNLERLHCRYCGYKEVFGAEAVAAFAKGEDIFCKLCLERRESCVAKNIRKRPIGNMHPGIIHYQQAHPDGPFIAKMAERDSDCDLLIVIGTSLKVEGVKKLVKMFARLPGTQGKRILVNLTPPTKEWNEVFDYFYEGDCGDFVAAVQAIRKPVRSVPSGQIEDKSRNKGDVQNSIETVPIVPLKKQSIEAHLRRISISLIGSEGVSYAKADVCTIEQSEISEEKPVGTGHESFLTVESYDKRLLKAKPSPPKSEMFKKLERLAETFDNADLIAQPILDNLIKEAPEVLEDAMPDTRCRDLEAEVFNIVEEEAARANSSEVRLTPKKKPKKKQAKGKK